MFEPENDLERALLQAFASSESIPSFLRMLLESEVFVVLSPTLRTGIPIVPAKRSFFNLFRS